MSGVKPDDENCDGGVGDTVTGDCDGGVRLAQYSSDDMETSLDLPWIVSCEPIPGGELSNKSGEDILMFLLSEICRTIYVQNYSLQRYITIHNQTNQ